MLEFIALLPVVLVLAWLVGHLTGRLVCWLYGYRGLSDRRW